MQEKTWVNRVFLTNGLVVDQSIPPFFYMSSFFPIKKNKNIACAKIMPPGRQMRKEN